ncbi:MAG: alpha-amylase family glycosyl hydrolase, partial [Anaerolineae bacterium]|nr:alpha-amylase family glycosyl hydrolase [Anaerolineae bacterium]
LAGWHKAAGGEGYYFGLFWGGMPDLNLENPAVTQEIYDIAAFWLEQGVDGFRLDAAKHLIEEGSNYSNTQATHTWWKAFRTYIKDINPEALILGETWDESVNVAKYVQGDEHDMDFDFGLAYGYVSAAARGQAIQANYPLRQNIELFPPNTFAAFLTNHDMNRVMSDLGDDPAKAKAAAAMLLTGPGTPFIYYGEEIGMLGTKPDEDIRLPMQWSAEEYAGFTSSIPWRRLNLDYPGKNAALQSGEPGSLLSWYRRLIALRTQFPSLQTGDSFPISSKSPAVYSLLRTDGLRHVLVVINLGDKTTGDYALNLDTGPLPNGEYLAFSLIEAEVYPTLTIQEGGFSGYLPLPDLAPYQVLIIELEKGSD